MSLNTSKLKKDIKALLIDMMSKENNSVDEFADRLGEAIESYTKSGEVVVDAGISVATTGSASSQTGKTTSKGKGRIK